MTSIHSAQAHWPKHAEKSLNFIFLIQLKPNLVKVYFVLIEFHFIYG